MLNKLHLSGILGALTTLGGLAASPEVANLIPGKWSAVVVAVGALIQATTRAVHKGDVMEVPKPRSREF